MQESIPLYTCDMSLIRHISQDDVRLLGDRVRTHRNRRGHLKMAVLKTLSADYVKRHSGRRGDHFEQTLTNGVVHALRGVRGSR